MIARSTKPNRCKHCKERMPEDKARHVIHDDCIEPWLVIQRAKQVRKAEMAQRKAKRLERHETKLRLGQLKSRSRWAKEAQDAVNKYVRLRDARLGCVSCDKSESWDGQWHASHFRSVGAATAVRFHLWNIHKSCSVCNNWKSGNLSEYEPRLREKIGDERVNWLRTQNQLASYSIDYLKRLKQVMTKKAKRLEVRYGSR